jgi:hypothetical protein
MSTTVPLERNDHSTTHPEDVYPDPTRATI